MGELAVDRESAQAVLGTVLVDETDERLFFAIEGRGGAGGGGGGENQGRGRKERHEGDPSHLRRDMLNPENHLLYSEESAPPAGPSGAGNVPVRVFRPEA